MPMTVYEIRDSDLTGSANVDTQHLVLNVPSLARSACLRAQSHRWQISYEWQVGVTEGHVEIRNVDAHTLRADDVDPNDTAAVIAHVEHRLQAKGYLFDDRPSKDVECVASWAIRRQVTLRRDTRR